jgi:hypothetical protein
MEVILPVGVPVFASDLFVASIGHWINLFLEGVKKSRVDIHKM